MDGPAEASHQTPNQAVSSLSFTMKLGVTTVVLSVLAARGTAVVPANVEVYPLFARQAGSLTVDPSKTYQKMDGFGFS